jgi:hypothetical protein
MRDGQHLVLLAHTRFEGENEKEDENEEEGGLRVSLPILLILLILSAFSAQYSVQLSCCPVLSWAKAWMRPASVLT